MSERESRLERERRLRRAAVTAALHQAPDPAPDDPDSASEEESAAARRIEYQADWVDLQVRQAMARGDFDNLPGAGKPLRLPDRHDPDWWVKGLIERERITGVLPPALALRREDAELDAQLDREGSAEGVRRAVEDFNRRVVEARRQLQGGPPVVTATRDVEREVAAWQERRAERRARQRLLLDAMTDPRPARRAFWWRRRKR